MHGHDHGDLSGLGDDDHAQYFNQVRGDARYLQSVPQQDHGGLAGLGDDDHGQYYNQARGDARYLQDAVSDSKTYARNNGVWVEAGNSRWVMLGSSNTFSIASQTVLQDVTWSMFTMLVNRCLQVRGRLIYSTAAAADFKYKINVPSATIVTTRRTHILPGTTAIVSATDLSTLPTVILLGSVDGIGFIDFDSWIQTGATAQVFSFQIAQNASNVYPLSLMRGSYIEYGYF